MNEELHCPSLDTKLFPIILEKALDNLGLPKNYSQIGGGACGMAYLSNNKVYKITTDKSEAIESNKLVGKNNQHLANIFNVKRINTTLTDKEVFLIVLEYLNISKSSIFSDIEEELQELVKIVFNENVFDIIYTYQRDPTTYKNEYAEGMQGIFDTNHRERYYFNSLLKIVDELKANNIDSLDIQYHNLGLKPNGNLAFFDLGFGDTQDTHLGSIDISERVKSYMKGSSTFNIKDKCRFGGNADGTSNACDTGDISNFSFGSVDEGRVKKGDRDDIYRDENTIIVRPLTFQASCKYGAHTSWCTSAPSNEYIWSNNPKSVLIYIIQKNYTIDHEKEKNIGRYLQLKDKEDNGELNNETDIEEYQELAYRTDVHDLSKIALSINIDSVRNMAMFDANNVEITDDYNSYHELPISNNGKEAIQDYIEKTKNSFGSIQENIENYRNINDSVLEDVVQYLESLTDIVKPKSGIELSKLVKSYLITSQNIDKALEKSNDEVSFYDKLMKLKDILTRYGLTLDEDVVVNLPKGGMKKGFESYKIKNDGEVVGSIDLMDRDNKYLILDRIMIDDKHRGKGYADAAIKQLIDFADKNNKIITLTPDGTWGSNVEKLKRWYASNGFVLNKGKNKDFETMQLMYRLPKSGINEQDSGFDRKTFDSIRSFAKRKQYADQHYQKLGAGSSRIVYKLPSGNVLKLAKNAKGLAQNENECGLGQDHYFGDLLAKVIDCDQNDMWIVSEEAKKTTPQRFEEITGANFEEVGKLIRNVYANNRSRSMGQVVKQDQAIIDGLYENQFVSQLLEMMNSYDLGGGDLTRIDSYGEVLRNGQPDIVLRDYGLNDKTWDQHYDRNRKIREDYFDMNEQKEVEISDLPFKNDVEQAGGKIYSVGGAVRDKILGKESKDLDLLITGVPLDQLEVILKKYGKVDNVGKSFGIIKFNTLEFGELDIAIPRTETKNDAGGYQGFDVSSDHTLPIEKDLERRDFTINAIAKDSSGLMIDPYGGQGDIEKKQIKMVNPQAFSDDPLRMLRAVQFAARFNFNIEPETMKAIQLNAQKIKEISPERILIEFDKIVKKGSPMTVAKLLRQTGLYNHIFGINRGVDLPHFKNVRTMGEFIYSLTHKSPADFYKNNLKGDLDTYSEIKALEIGGRFNGDKKTIYDMYKTYPESINTKLLGVELSNMVEYMKTNKIPFSLKEVPVNGNDLMELGFQGKEIGVAFVDILGKIYKEELPNEREAILNYIKSLK